jgi:hypothetical protein
MGGWCQECANSHINDWNFANSQLEIGFAAKVVGGTEEAALPQHMAETLCLSESSDSRIRGYASKLRRSLKYLQAR